jgi:hypothetical protein
VALTPTLVFTLVIAGILRDVFEVPQAVFGGLVIYTLGNTLIPGFALRAPPEFELHAPDLDPALDPQVTYRVPTGTHRVAAAEGAGASSVPPDSSVSRPTDAGAATG